MTYTVDPIGYVHSCFKEKFAIPRQPLLAPAAQGYIELLPPYNQADAIAGLESISHIWVIFLFHKNLESTPRLKVRPPRLGGNKSIGVFASRATHRPNGIGQSVVRLERVELVDYGCRESIYSTAHRCWILNLMCLMPIACQTRITGLLITHLY